MLRFTDISFGLGGRTLLDHATAHVPVGHKVGLVGANGTGKTSLIRLILGEAELDGGEIRMRSHARVGVLSQEPPGGMQSALQATLAADLRLTALRAEAAVATDPHRIGWIHEQLEAIDAHSAESRAAAILAGLGFDEAAQHRPLNTFSGGWRMRVALASVLFNAPDLLLLDEPTNHLDLEATAWLENHIKHYPSTLLMVSHDRRLLTHSVDAILHLSGKKLEMYTGGYEAFLEARLMKQQLSEAERTKQAAAAKRMQAFVDRFRAKATKARQAQSRLKMLSRLTPITAPENDRRVSFSFPDPSPTSSPIVRLDEVSVGYDKAIPVLKDIRLTIYNDDRIALLGANGNGKTTLSRLLAGKLTPITGTLFRAGRIEVGYFAQDHLDLLEPDLTPVEQMRRIMTDAPMSAIRGWLGRFGLGEDKAEVAAANLSGGEKTRMVLAMAMRYAPNLLILDEPTNHLDIDSREALIQALIDYKGAVVLVSHDRHLVESTVDQLWVVRDGAVEAFSGDMDDYYETIVAERKKERSERRHSDKESTERSDRKLTRKQAAEERARLAPLKKRALELETALQAHQEKKEAVDRTLGLPETYSGDPAQIERLVREQRTLSSEIDALEEAWLDAAAALEEALRLEEGARDDKDAP